MQWSGELGFGERAPEAGQSELAESDASPMFELRDIIANKMFIRHGGNVR